MDYTEIQPPQDPGMMPSNAQTKAKDLPVKLTSLDQALQPFRHSYPHTVLNLAVFDVVLQDVYECHKEFPDELPPTGEQEHIHELWSRLSRTLRYPHSSWYADPESLQVAQLMAKQDPVRIWFELYSHVRQDILNGDPIESVMDIGQWYTKVQRGVKWLVECATLSLSEERSKEDDTAIANLTAVATCGPIYGSGELNPAPAHSQELFGPGGVLWSVMEVFTREPGAKRGIACILDLVIALALNIALIFKYSWEHHARMCDQQPAYKWYAMGLEEARSRFRTDVQCQDPQALLPYHIRDVLKDIDLIGLWDAIWNKANLLSRTFGFEPQYLECNLFIWAVQQMKLPSSDPRPWIPLANVALITEMRCKEYEMNTEGALNSAPSDFCIPPEDFDVSNIFKCRVNVEVILRSRGPRFSSTGRGQRFYDEDDNPEITDADNEEREIPDLTIADTADVEPYGPLLDLTDLAAATTTVPEDQCCTICMEDHSHSSSDSHAGTMKLNSCGHLFHYKCIFEWLNGTSSNSNLCPECRVQFSE
ncbi:uncharacterized protein J4E84_001649 [Alternaria hordeiaustralica]|uniref:uncharacterized protein n=1 Tax=Alternaria hordeiaustralica TaxID=1187925 RepID=UPI0020C48FE1|nr:uncharacterized protein J4E84_001649 [Alternaria hordeiaustralica]KAI4695025.1 hypothetical protein J4E84_001649 [Alternaria hordeiaustralica]